MLRYKVTPASVLKGWLCPVINTCTCTLDPSQSGHVLNKQEVFRRVNE